MFLDKIMLYLLVIITFYNVMGNELGVYGEIKE